MLTILPTGMRHHGFRHHACHTPGMRDNSRTRFHPLQLRDQPGIQLWKQVECHNVGITKIELEDIPLLDGHQVLKMSRFHIGQGFLDSIGVDINAHRLAAVFLGRGYHDAAIATAQVIEQIGLLHSGQFQHQIHDRLRRGNIADIKSSGLRPRGLFLGLDGGGKEQTDA